MIQLLECEWRVYHYIFRTWLTFAIVLLCSMDEPGDQFPADEEFVDIEQDFDLSAGDDIEDELHGIDLYADDIEIDDSDAGEDLEANEVDDMDF